MRATRIAIIACLALSCVVPKVGAQPAEAAKVRVLLVLDTLDRMGETWGLDGKNMKALIETAMAQQKLEGRFTIDMLTGGSVNPDNILNYYRNLQTGPNETLMFFYSGHGGYHVNRGHYVALTLGKLYRNDLMAAMDLKKPKLRVVLTDCCANYSGGAWQKEPPNPELATHAGTGQAGKRPAARIEPPSQTQIRQVKKVQYREPPRPDAGVLKKVHKPAKFEEPPDNSAGMNSVKSPPTTKKAKNEEPPATVRVGVQLRTPTGSVGFSELLEKIDGQVLRHLLFRHEGVVDINGCKKGLLSHGTKEWGGSLFTIGFMLLQEKKPAELDGNRNAIVEWSEFFPLLQRTTEEVAQRTMVGNKMGQSPEAFQLKVVGK